MQKVSVRRYAIWAVSLLALFLASCLGAPTVQYYVQYNEWIPLQAIEGVSLPPANGRDQDWLKNSLLGRLRNRGAVPEYGGGSGFFWLFYRWLQLPLPSDDALKQFNLIVPFDAYTTTPPSQISLNFTTNAELKVDVSSLLIQLLESGAITPPAGVTRDAAKKILESLAPDIQSSSATVVTTKDHRFYTLDIRAQHGIKRMLSSPESYPLPVNYVVSSIFVADVEANVDAALSIVTKQHGFRFVAGRSTTTTAENQALGYRLSRYTRFNEKQIKIDDYKYNGQPVELLSGVSVAVRKSAWSSGCVIDFTGLEMEARDSEGKREPLSGFLINNCAGRDFVFSILKSGTTYASVRFSLPSTGAGAAQQSISIRGTSANFSVEVLKIDEVADL